MEMAGDPPPLWPQLTNSVPRRRSPSPLFSPPILIILLPIITLLLLFFAVPPFLSITTQIFRPNGVRKSWDSLNIFLVLFAILCGVFARRNDDDDNNINSSSVRNDSNNNKASHQPVSQQWFDYPERKIFDDPPINTTSSATSVRRLKRSSSSYPDLRQDSLWENINTEDRFRFFDDFELDKYRSSTSYHDGSWRSGFEEFEAKVIPVDTVVLRSSASSTPSKSPAPSSTPPPPPPPPPAARHKPRRPYQAVGQKEKEVTQNDHVGFNKVRSPQPVTPPPPPRPPPSPLIQVGNRSEQRYAKLERRKSNATKEIKMVFASLRKRKKKQKVKDQHHDRQQDHRLHSPYNPPPYYSTNIPPPSPPPPPPPPAPPSSVFQKYNLFRKGSKSKKIHSIHAPPPPPPPPPTFSLSKRSSKQNTHIPPTPPPAPAPPAFFHTKKSSKQKSQIPPPTKPAPAPPTPPPEPSRRRTTANSGRPPLPTKANTSYYDENVNSGGQSPLIPMPPAPPPPPFKMPDFKFLVRGDFVKIRSSPSSRCSSPDLEEVDVSSSKDDVETVSMMDGDDGVGFGAGVGGVRVFCPSPDVNAKAETFIAGLRDRWKLEKINSMKEKQRI